MKKHPILRWILIIYLAVGVFSFIKYTVSNNLQNESTPSSRVAASPVPRESLDDILNRCAELLMSEFPDHSRAEYNPDTGFFLLFYWIDYIEPIAEHAISGIEPFVTSWNDLRSSTAELSLAIQSEFDTAGYRDVKVGVYMLNPNSKGLALLFASRGIVLYDAVAENSVDPQSAGYTVDLSSSVFHLPICPELHNIPSETQVTFTGTVDYLLSNGYMPCSTCILQTDSIREAVK